MTLHQASEDLVRALSRLVFACVVPGQDIIKLFDQETGKLEDYRLVKVCHDVANSSPAPLCERYGLLPPRAFLDDVLHRLKVAASEEPQPCTVSFKKSVMSSCSQDHPAACTSVLSTAPRSLRSGIVYTSSNGNNSDSFDDLNEVGPFSGIRRTLFYGDASERRHALASLSPPPVTPPPNRGRQASRMNDSHPSDADSSSSSVECVFASDEEQRSGSRGEGEEGADDSWTAYDNGGSSEVDRRDVSAMLAQEDYSLYGLESLPSGISPFGAAASALATRRVGVRIGRVTRGMVEESPFVTGPRQPGSALRGVRIGALSFSLRTSTPAQPGLGGAANGSLRAVALQSGRDRLRAAELGMLLRGDTGSPLRSRSRTTPLRYAGTPARVLEILKEHEEPRCFDKPRAELAGCALERVTTGEKP